MANRDRAYVRKHDDWFDEELDEQPGGRKTGDLGGGKERFRGAYSEERGKGERGEWRGGGRGGMRGRGGRGRGGGRGRERGEGGERREYQYVEGRRPRQQINGPEEQHVPRMNAGGQRMAEEQGERRIYERRQGDARDREVQGKREGGHGGNGALYGRERAGGERHEDRQGNHNFARQMNQWGGHAYGRDAYGCGPSNFLTRQDVEKLSICSSEQVLVYVMDNEKKFLAAYKFEKFCNNPVMLKHLIKLLYLLALCEDTTTALRIIAQLFNPGSSDYAMFLNKVNGLVRSMPIEPKPFVRNENPLFLNYLVEVGSMAIRTIPRTVITTFPIDSIHKTLENLAAQGREKVENLSIKVQELEQAFKLATSQIVERTVVEPREKVPSPDKADVDPPQPFTELSILPTVDEIHSTEVFLRPNVVKGAYRGWEHYLDVQFRLLREDFVQPLRKGINQYCDTGSGRKLSEVNVYEKVNVLNPVCLVSGVGFQIRFDVSRFKTLNWEHSKRLIFGSLLCLSSDDFDQRILFASVANRDASLLKDGLLLVKFEGDTNGFTIDPEESFVMVESTAYFEAYRHVLESLRELSKFADAVLLTMKKYIVDCQLHSVNTPSFLRIRRPVFDFKHVLNVSKEVDITDSSAWPLAEKTSLNVSQMKAFKMALTNELCIIQGPPGTGKTYVGLKIVSGYLHNRKVWDPQFASPILVVCYTNHALDQFLEGIQECIVDGHEPSIVRVGGRCKSEKLAGSVLRQRVQEVRSKRLLTSEMHKSYIHAHNTMQRCQKDIDQAIENCDKASRKILDLSVLGRVVPQDYVTQLMYGRPTEAGKEVEVWLELWYPEHAKNTSESAKAQAGTAIDGDIDAGTTVNDDVPVRQDAAHQAQQNATDSEEDEAEYIEVDNEARVIQEERMIEGEEDELPRAHGHQATEVPEPAKKKDQNGWTTVQISASKRKSLMNKGLKRQPMSHADVLGVHDVWELSIKEKWQLYCFWLNKYIRLCKGQVKRQADIYNIACEYYREAKNEIDCYVINSQHVDVIGMTTTGAAKHHHILEGIHPKIVIFEEAAEIFEAHVVTSLPASVQQVVLIGDHKQLQPKPNCYDLGKDYNFAVSLFERFTKNDMDYITLNFQHRMRPEIARLISPSIYEDLINHDQVKAYEPIKGISKNMFLVDHSHPEELNVNNDLKSHVNKHEAGFLMELCHYLLKQGYSHKQITILTMYRGQLLELRKRMRRQYFEGVRVAAVDDYQGEENDIILLSLVRSNNEGKIGFLGIENRVCVSLSRARQGLYIVGNVSMLRDKIETVWPKIIKELEDQKSIGKALPLYCQIHADDKLDACIPEDFRNRPEGGCSKVCGVRLDCGHSCTKLCHPTDREHNFFMCTEKCQKELPCSHLCRHKCFECKQGCLPCCEQVKKTRPACGHVVSVPCSSDPSSILCPFPCPKKLPCGHDCQDFCSDPCTRKCYSRVLKKFPCGHVVQLPCFINPNSTPCPTPCVASLECEHKCTGTCGECHLGRLHVKCSSECGRLLVCGHICNFPCGAACPPCMKPCNNFCHHSHCPRKCYEPCQPCRMKCKWQCPHHECTKLCGESCDRQRCNEPCTKTLKKCGHPCIGLCGEKCPSKCRECDKEDVQELFFGDEEEEDARFIQLEDCNDIIKVTGLDRWMKIDDSGVKFKVCPKCSTPIRKSFRYGNAIKQVLCDLQAIKLKQAEASHDLPAKLSEVQEELRDSKCTEYIDSELKFIKNEVQRHNTLNSFRVNAIHFQLRVLPKLLKLSNVHKALKPVYNLLNLSGCSPERIAENSVTLKRFVMQDFLSRQQISDAVHEVLRLTCSAKLLDLLCKIRVMECRIAQTDLTAIMDEVKRVHSSGANEHEKLTEVDETKVCEFIKLLSNKYSVDGLSDEKRIQIVQAIGLAKGHWYKCPNGHFYTIADCGGAVMTSTCPDCKSTVGGTAHQLSAGNQHAPEMDGSEYPAWSNEANENYIPPF